MIFLQRARIRGFTYIELIVVFTILALIAVFSVATFQSIVRNSAARVASLEVADALRVARSNTLAAKNDVVYGVRIASSSVTRFVGSVYVSGHASNTTYIFEAGTYATGTLAVSSTTITFARLTGMPSATGSILIYDMNGNPTATVTIEGTGLVE
jgi:Tfp pilus assembly protein FimT